MNIALTGANGSIGRELTPFLKGLGHNIYTISSSVQSDGECIFSYADLFEKTINSEYSCQQLHEILTEAMKKQLLQNFLLQKNSDRM